MSFAFTTADCCCEPCGIEKICLFLEKICLFLAEEAFEPRLPFFFFWCFFLFACLRANPNFPFYVTCVRNSCLPAQGVWNLRSATLFSICWSQQTHRNNKLQYNSRQLLLRNFPPMHILHAPFCGTSSSPGPQTLYTWKHCSAPGLWGRATPARRGRTEHSLSAHHPPPAAQVHLAQVEDFLHSYKEAKTN